MRGVVRTAREGTSQHAHHHPLPRREYPHRRRYRHYHQRHRPQSGASRHRGAEIHYSASRGGSGADPRAAVRGVRARHGVAVSPVGAPLLVVRVSEGCRPRRPGCRAARQAPPTPRVLPLRASIPRACALRLLSMPDCADAQTGGLSGSYFSISLRINQLWWQYGP